MASLDLVIIAAYMVGMVAVGFWTQRKATNQEQFLVAGRSVGPLLYSGTLAAIIIGGGATIGGVKLGYTYGISGMWLVSMYGLGMIVMGVVLVPRILKLRLYTIPELLQRRYGASARIAGGIVMGCYDFMIVVVAIIAIGAIAEVMAGVSRTQAILLCSAVMIGYSVLGGMWALTATDIVQFAIKTVGILFILLPFAIIRAGGLAGMQQNLPTGFFSMSHIGWDKIASFVTLYFLGILIGQDGWQRVFTARSVSVADGTSETTRRAVSASSGGCRPRIRRDRQGRVAHRSAWPRARRVTRSDHVHSDGVPARDLNGLSRGRIPDAEEVRWHWFRRSEPRADADTRRARRRCGVCDARRRGRAHGGLRPAGRRDLRSDHCRHGLRARRVSRCLRFDHRQRHSGHRADVREGNKFSSPHLRGTYRRSGPVPRTELAADRRSAQPARSDEKHGRTTRLNRRWHANRIRTFRTPRTFRAFAHERPDAEGTRMKAPAAVEVVGGAVSKWLETLYAD